MDKLKNLLIPVVSLVLVVLFARLPQIVLWATDMFTGNNGGTIPMEAIQTTQPEDEDVSSVIHLLQMERNMYSVPISTEQASMTESQVLEIVEQWMQDCQDAGFFTIFHPSYQNIEAYLCMDMINKGHFGVIWGVELTAEEMPYQDFFVHLDDATGKILYVNYQTSSEVESSSEPYTSTGGNEVEGTQLIQQLESLADVYFRQLGYAEAAEYARTTGTGYSCEILSEDTACATYSFGDSQYGEINMDFYIYGAGSFHNYFP